MQAYIIDRLDSKGVVQEPMGVDLREMDEDEPWLLSAEGGLRGHGAGLGLLLARLDMSGGQGVLTASARKALHNI